MGNLSDTEGHFSEIIQGGWGPPVEEFIPGCAILPVE